MPKALFLSAIDRNQVKTRINKSRNVGDSRDSVVLGEIMPCLLFVVIERSIEGAWQIRREVFKWKRRRNG